MSILNDRGGSLRAQAARWSMTDSTTGPEAPTSPKEAM